MERMLQEIVKDAGKDKPKLEYSLTDSVLIPLPTDQDKEEFAKEIDELITVETPEDSDFISLRYLPLDENLLPHVAYHERDNLDSIYCGMKKIEEEYEPPKLVKQSDDGSEYGSLTEEIREEIKDLKYDFLDQREIDPRKMKLLVLYIALNPAEFAFYECLLGLNRDSVYQ